MNEEIINKRWNITRNELKKFQKWYSNQSKITQDKIQEIVNYYNIEFDKLNSTISKNDKERLKRQIEYWKSIGIYDGYFKYKLDTLLKKNINYSSLIEILIYATYLEEEKEVIDKTDNLFQTILLDNYNQGKKDLNKKRVKTLPNYILDDMYVTLIDGIIFIDYLNALYLTYSQEIYKQYIIDKQQNINTDIYSNSLQKIFEKQRNRLISTSDNKYSGGLDKYATAYGNLSYIDASGKDNKKVKFISDHCEHVTEMCEYMDGMIFNTTDENIFTRPIGDTQKDLKLEQVNVKGLVLGINQPPITKHFHWCHSCLTYLIDLPLEKMYNITNPDAFVERIKIKDLDKKIIEYENKIRNEKIEHMYVIQANGNVYHFTGTDNNVKPEGIDLENSIITHNHPSNQTNYSLSPLDKMLFSDNNVKRLRGTDNKYTYEFNKDINFKENIPSLDYENIDDPNSYHLNNILDSYKYDFGYKRWKNDK